MCIKLTHLTDVAAKQCQRSKCQKMEKTPVKCQKNIPKYACGNDTKLAYVSYVHPGIASKAGFGSNDGKSFAFNFRLYAQGTFAPNTMK